MNDLNVAMVLSLKDKLLGPLSRAVDQVERDFKGLEQQASKTARASGTTADNLAKVGRAAGSTRQAATEMRKLGDEAARANREVGKLEQAGGRLRSIMQGMAKGVAGTMAFSHVVAEPLRQAADYDTQLRMLSNTAYAGKTLAERRAGMGTLNGAITNAVRTGGGNREQALGALNDLVGSGTFGNVKDAADLLPLVMRGSTASGAAPGDIAQIMIRAKQNMGIGDTNGMALALDKAMAAGQAGGFELKDMAKWLPNQMALGSSIGLRGQSGLTELLAANQASVMTAGSRDEAGNNLVNLLGKVNSQDTAQDFKKLGIDLPGTLTKAQAKGMSSLEAFVALVDSVVTKDPRFARAKAAADRTTGDDKKAALTSQVDLLQGSAVGKVVQDRQALMALVALMGNQGYLSTVKGKINSSKGSINDAAALITEGAGYAFDQRNFETQKAQTDAMTSANSAVVKLAEAQTDLYRRYPGFAQAVEGAKVAVTGLAAAAAGAGVVNLLTGGAGAAAAATLGTGAATATGVAATAATGALALGATAVLAAPALAAINPNREFVGAVADPTMMGSADFAGALAESMAQTTAAANAAKAAAERPIQVNVHLDGRQIESTVTKRQDQTARRQ
jgi:hypothetical protein